MRSKVVRTVLLALLTGIAAGISCSKPQSIATELNWDRGSWDVQSWQ
jgi:hypothetical protein